MHKEVSLKEFQNKELTGALAEEIRREARETPRRRYRFMEVCGTHTNSFFRFGLGHLLPDTIELLSGPGCPVCVTPNETLDYAIAYSRQPDMIIATFGDMLKVPGSRSSLLEERSKGADIRVVYSATDAVKIAENTPGKTVLFIGIGFETTSPSIALAVLDASRKKLDNFLLLSALKVMPPVMDALFRSKAVRIDGLLCPGHVSVITGTGIYKPVARRYRVPCVVAGFEPVDMMKGILTLLRLSKERRGEVVNDYSRVVDEDGNREALKIVNIVFEPCNAGWRGIGVINASGLKLRKEFKEFDVLLRRPIEILPPEEHSQCICGSVLRGVKRPTDCSLYRNVCTPEHPIGACMVSSEGNCAIYYKYGIR